MSDSDGPEIAKVVYKAIFESPYNRFSLAEIVDHAVRYLRDTMDVPSEHWATFVHTLTED